MNTFWISLVSFLNKVAPFILVGLAYLKGKSAARQEVDKENLEKQVEYAQIEASKPDTVDDDIDRMHSGTY